MPPIYRHLTKLVNPLPVIDEFTELAFRRSRKLIAFKHDRRLAKRIESFCGAQPTQKLCWTERPESGRSGLWNFQRRV